MLYSGTDPESYTTESTLVYEDYNAVYVSNTPCVCVDEAVCVHRNP